MTLTLTLTQKTTFNPDPCPNADPIKPNPHPHPSPLTPHPSPFTPHPSPFTLTTKNKRSILIHQVLVSEVSSSQASIEAIDDICLLTKNTGYTQSVLDRNGLPKRPPGYPEEYFGRFIRKLGIDHNLISMMIARLRSEDMYSQIPSYPLPRHRSTALATQARMLYILLFFEPKILEESGHMMREIVDKHFADNWVVAYYMGFTVELPHAWDSYKAAKIALGNTIQPANIKRFYDTQFKSMNECRKLLSHHLTEGVLTQEYALEKSLELLHCARECNVCIRWIMLHRTSKVRKTIREAEDPAREAEATLMLLLHTAQYEYLLRNLFTGLLDDKEKMWERAKSVVDKHLMDLADFFAGSNTLSRVGKDEQLQSWFAGLADQVRQLEVADSTIAGRKMHHLIEALKEVEQFHQIEQSLQIKQYLAEVREMLFKMIRIVNVRELELITLGIVSDMSYAWEAMGDYTELMRMRIQRDPFSVLKLRATFLKLVSILDSPLVRINQAASPDLESVSQYYSSEVASYMRRVLQVIPENMFSVLNEIIELQSHSLKELPVKVSRNELREWAQLEQRHRLARATHRVSVLTEGVLTMQTTSLGVVQVDPRELLQDGIRRELVRQLTATLQSHTNLKPGKPADLEASLCKLLIKLEGFQLSLEYISDYVKMNGLQLWHEEFANLINFYVEQERNAFLKKKVHSWQSTFALAASAVDNAPPAAFAHSFFGRLVRELAHLTSPRRAYYSMELGSWLDNTGKEVVGSRILMLLRRTFGHVGLRGIDSTFGFMVTAQLHRFVAFYRQVVSSDLFEQLERYATALAPVQTLPDKLSKHYATAAQSFGKLMNEAAVAVSRCGNAKLLRNAMIDSLRDSCEIEAPLLHRALVAADGALLIDAHETTATEDLDVHTPRALVDTAPKTSKACEEYDELLASVSPYVDAAGLRGRCGQIFVVDDPIPHLSLMMSFYTVMQATALSCVWPYVLHAQHNPQHIPNMPTFLIWQLSRMAWNESLGLYVTVGRGSVDDAIDGVPLAVGVHCILEQFHQSLVGDYVGYLLQYLRALVSVDSDRKIADAPEVSVLVEYMKIYCEAARFECPEIEAYS